MFYGYTLRAGAKATVLFLTSPLISHSRVEGVENGECADKKTQHMVGLY